MTYVSHTSSSKAGPQVHYSKSTFHFQLPENANHSSGIDVRLGDNSVVSTNACKRLTFEVKGESHTWDFHFMELPVGLDLIVGMDFMRKHDVILLTASLKVLFGNNNVLNYATLAYSVDEPKCKYGHEGESDTAMVTDHEHQNTVVLYSTRSMTLLSLHGV